MDYYNILEVDKNASQAEIKKSYRTLSLKYHPDKQKDNSDAKFKEINEAYQLLSNPQKRQFYDLQNNNNSLNQENIFENLFKHMENNIFSGSCRNPLRKMPIFPLFEKMGFEKMGFEDMGFNMLPPSLIKNVKITLKQAYRGIEYPLEIERWIESNNYKTTETEKIYITIPPGVDDNEIIIINNKGNILNQKQGNIKININIINNTDFIRRGINLYYVKKITLKEALLGFSFDFSFIDGRCFTINNLDGSIIHPDYTRNIKNLGMQRGDTCGDLILSFKIIFPTSLNNKQIKQLQMIF